MIRAFYGTIAELQVEKDFIGIVTASVSVEIDLGKVSAMHRFKLANGIRRNYWSAATGTLNQLYQMACHAGGFQPRIQGVNMGVFRSPEIDKLVNLRENLVPILMLAGRHNKNSTRADGVRHHWDQPENFARISMDSPFKGMHTLHVHNDKTISWKNLATVLDTYLPIPTREQKERAIQFIDSGTRVPVIMSPTKEYLNEDSGDQGSDA